ncbi:RNA-binding S4 domain-containing protein [Paracoccus sp. (in: a-proteobacteria)]|uniref:RNA-binding S4 domain-containing protein n=1 Tax=Paracoccus sp. TaxID=267 RepID=UPI003220520A
MSGDAGTIRLDRWLHHARMFKTRSLAADAIGGGGIRVNGQPCSKPAHSLRPGDVVTVSAHGRVRVLRVLLLGERRGPASEAALLYEDIPG